MHHTISSLYTRPITASSPEGKLRSPPDITYRLMPLSLCVASVFHKLSKFIIIAGDILSIVLSSLMQFRNSTKRCTRHKSKRCRSDPIIICNDEGSKCSEEVGLCLFMSKAHPETRRSFIVHIAKQKAIPRRRTILHFGSRLLFAEMGKLAIIIQIWGRAEGRLGAWQT